MYRGAACFVGKPKPQEKLRSDRIESVPTGSTLIAFVGFVLVRLDSVRLLSVGFYSIRFGPIRFGLSRFGPRRLESVRPDSVRFGLVRFGSIRFGSNRFGSNRFDSVRFEFGWVRFVLGSNSIRLVSLRLMEVALGFCCIPGRRGGLRGTTGMPRTKKLR